MFKTFQRHTITTYRTAAIAMLLIIVTGVLSYLFLLAFYTLSRSWSAPITLSPAQERVLSFQPQIATLETNLLKQKVDLHTAEDKYFNGIKSQLDIRKFLIRLEQAQKAEAGALANNSGALNTVIREKSSDVIATEKSIKGIKEMMKAVTDELAVGLITKDQAQSRTLLLQTALNSMTDAKAQIVVLQEQSRIAAQGSITLKGTNSTSLQALQSIQELVQLRTVLAQLEVDTETARLTIDQLKASVIDGERVLTVAKSSPYFLALRAPVTVLFVPYDNLKNAKVGEPVYDCFLQVIFCSKVATITKVYDAEEYARHPLFKTDIKGRFAEATFTNKDAAKSNVLFIGGKPLLI